MAEISIERPAARSEPAADGLPAWAKATLGFAFFAQSAWIVAICWGLYALLT